MVVTSLINAVIGGSLFALVGLPAPVLWGTVMFILGILPVVGIALVWVPAAIYLALSGQGLPALVLVIWGVLSSILVDNLLYVRLAGGRLRMHPVPALLAFLGGLAVFGVSGMILGPAIAAITEAVLQVWKNRMAEVERDAPRPSLSSV
jgi:predicted PurR-regulated permease PerM